MADDQGAAVADAPASGGTDENIRRLQSKYDAEVAQLKRAYNEERSLADELHGSVTELQEQIAQLRARDYANDDPEVAQLRRELDEARKKAKDADSTMNRFRGELKRSLVTAHAWDLADGDRSKVAKFTEALNVAKSPAELERLALSLRETGVPGRSAPAAKRSEIDEGRGSGRAGPERITRKALAEHNGDVAWFKENRDRINAALKEGGGSLPDQ